MIQPVEVVQGPLIYSVKNLLGLLVVFLDFILLDLEVPHQVVEFVPLPSRDDFGLLLFDLVEICDGTYRVVSVAMRIALLKANGTEVLTAAAAVVGKFESMLLAAGEGVDFVKFL